MKVTVSNLAWNVASDDEVFALLAEKGIGEIEIAPTKYVPDIAAATPADARDVRLGFERKGVSVVAFQALLFGKPHLKIFGDEQVRRDTLDYLKRVIDLAAALGAGRVIFGSPKNRFVEGMDPAEAYGIGLEFFRALGEHGAAKGVAFCIEPNAAAYGCNFMTESDRTARFVRDVASAGFRLHLDLGVMRMNGEDVGRLVDENMDILEHFHVSEPHLKPVRGEAPDVHRAAAAALRRNGYDGRVSIEMLESPEGLAAIGHALDFVLSVYGD